MIPPRDWEQEFFWKVEILSAPKRREREVEDEDEDEDESEE